VPPPLTQPLPGGMPVPRGTPLSPGSSAPPTVRKSGPKVGRNDPCPCGSGKKYKFCHGAS